MKCYDCDREYEGQTLYKCVTCTNMLCPGCVLDAEGMCMDCYEGYEDQPVGIPQSFISKLLYAIQGRRNDGSFI